MKFPSDLSGLFPAIIKQAPYGIVVCRVNGEVVYANQLASFLLQRPLAGTNLNSISPLKEKLLDRFGQLFNSAYNALAVSTALETTTAEGCSLRCSSLEDSQLYFQIRRLENGSPTKDPLILIFIEDLSARETLALSDRNYTDRLEELVNETSRKLEDIQEKLLKKEKMATMAETAGGIAHELRQPMTAIIGAIQLLELPNREIPDDRTRRLLQTIEKQCLRMDEIIAKMEKLVSYKTQEYASGRIILDLDRSSRQSYRDSPLPKALETAADNQD